MRYLAVVEVLNLHPSDYCNGRTEKIETIINSMISPMLDIEANGENMVFSFPKDPSVDSTKIPVVVKVRFWSPAVFGPPQNDMADWIRDRLLLFFGPERGDVLVSIESPGNITRSPRS